MQRKVGVFSLNTGYSLSDVFSLNGARVILGPDLQTFDENKDGYSELIVPFATGEVFTLSSLGDSLLFKESSLSESGLFNLKPDSGEQQINDVILKRGERGLNGKDTLAAPGGEFAFLLPFQRIFLHLLLNLKIGQKEMVFFSFFLKAK